MVVYICQFIPPSPSPHSVPHHGSGSAPLSSVCFLDLRMGFSLRSRYKWDPQPGGRQRNATWGREEPWGGQQTTGSRKREMEEEVVGGGRGGQRPRSKGAREDSLQVSTLPTNIPRSAKYCCFPGRPKLETVSAHNLGRGPGSLLCLPCPMRGPRAEVRRSSLMGGWS